ncbi:MAG: PEPxxWA-CTERM sorting domain-containing protein [Pseudomonadota bacterium]
MFRIQYSLLAIAASMAVATPAAATVEICFEVGNDIPQCGATTVNVLVNQQTGAVVTASDNDNTTNVTYDFRSSTETSLVQVASGQADVSSSDGVINQIDFNIIGGTTDLITFNLIPLGPQSTGTDATTVTVTFIGAITGATSQQIFNLNPNGNNFYGVQATGGDLLTGLSFGSFVPTGSGIQALNQVRLNLTPSVSAVPEPATWAMMLMGFGAMGVTLRRRRRGNALLQAA